MVPSHHVGDAEGGVARRVLSVVVIDVDSIFGLQVCLGGYIIALPGSVNPDLHPCAGEVLHELQTKV